MAQAQNKQEFIKRWEEHLNETTRINYSLEPEEQSEVIDLINKLRTYVRKAADYSYSDNPGHLKDNPTTKTRGEYANIWNYYLTKPFKRDFLGNYDYPFMFVDEEYDTFNPKMEKEFKEWVENDKGLKFLIKEKNNPKHNPISEEQVYSIYYDLDSEYKYTSGETKQEIIDDLSKRYNVKKDIIKKIIDKYGENKSGVEIYKEIEKEYKSNNPNSNKPKPLKIKAYDYYWHIRFKNPSKYKEFRVPDWAAKVANSIYPDAQVTMGYDKDANKWELQKVMIPITVDDEQLVKKLAEDIACKIDYQCRKEHLELKNKNNSKYKQEDVYTWTLDELSKPYSEMNSSSDMERMVKNKFGWNDDIENEAWAAWETYNKE